ncbi:hypothetical protein IEO21_03427 [Rhodonia placenta]|uniref:Uncharacterized protein n=1 Tax=Rhodonia placenta TaxID=104341 RepID=A0A8H7P698_9APHY|nr:hypothetical protein IEO21_03427 [Postia placenta]
MRSFLSSKHLGKSNTTSADEERQHLLSISKSDSASEYFVDLPTGDCKSTSKAVKPVPKRRDIVMDRGLLAEQYFSLHVCEAPCLRLSLWLTHSKGRALCISCVDAHRIAMAVPKLASRARTDRWDTATLCQLVTESWWSMGFRHTLNTKERIISICVIWFAIYVLALDAGLNLN